MQATMLDMSEVKRRAIAAGSHWFDPDAMRFFNSVLEGDAFAVNGNAYFVTSEQYVNHSTGESAPRWFTIRQQKPNGHIDTLGTFQKHPTYHDACAALFALITEASK